MKILHNKNGIVIEEIKPDVLLVRGYPDGVNFPGQFEWVSMAILSDDKVKFVGFLHVSGGKGSLKHAREIRYYFKFRGCKKITYERIKSGTVNVVNVNI